MVHRVKLKTLLFPHAECLWSTQFPNFRLNSFVDIVCETDHEDKFTFKRMFCPGDLLLKREQTDSQSSKCIGFMTLLKVRTYTRLTMNLHRKYILLWLIIRMEFMKCVTTIKIIGDIDRLAKICCE